MNVVDMMSDGLETVRENENMLLIPLIKYAILIILSCLLFIPFLIVSFGMAFNPLYGTAAFIVFALLSLLAYAAINSYFTAALAGLGYEAVHGKKTEVKKGFDWGSKRWLNLLKVQLGMGTLYLLSFTLFIPAAALVFLKMIPLAASIGMATLAFLLIGWITVAVSMQPLTYLTVLTDKPYIEYFKSSARYVKDNLAASLTIFFTSTLASNILVSLASILTGPPTRIPYIGKTISLLLSVPLYLAVFIAVEVVTVTWWMGLLKAKKPK